VAKLRESLKIVCHQTRSPENLGAIARLMANFGYRRLVLSEPTDFFSFGDAQKMAVGAHDLLKATVVTPSLDLALEDVVFACGTTSRAELKGRRALTPEQAGRVLAEHAERGPVALVLGGEKRGLSDQELSRCQEVLVIPTEETQPSMNLAQSAAVLLYLFAQADRLSEPTLPVQTEEAARLQIIHALEERMRGVFAKAGFLNPQSPHAILDELLRCLGRAALTRREAELWLASYKALDRKL
jgi:tRNA/rRNA methyltransferase